MTDRNCMTVRHTRRRVLKYFGALTVGVAAPFVARMDRALAAWPGDRPVRIIVPNSPGGPSDLTARFMAPALREALGGVFVVENRPGGSGSVGTQALIRAEPDGYTLGVVTSSFGINSVLRKPAPYDAINDLVPVAELISSPSSFVVKPELGVSTMKEAVALAKKDQAKFNIGTPPIGSTLHLGAELLKFREGLDRVAVIVHSGGGQAVLGLLAGNFQLGSSSLGPVHGHLKAGTLKGLAILGEERWHDLPDIPTAAEAGYEDFNFETCMALMAPHKTPPEVLKMLEAAALGALKRPDFRDRIIAAGFHIRARTGAEHAARLRREIPMFKEIIERANIKA